MSCSSRSCSTPIAALSLYLLVCIEVVPRKQIFLKLMKKNIFLFQILSFKIYTLNRISAEKKTILLVQVFACVPIIKRNLLSVVVIVLNWLLFKNYLMRKIIKNLSLIPMEWKEIRSLYSSTFTKESCATMGDSWLLQGHLYQVGSLASSESSKFWKFNYSNNNKKFTLLMKSAASIDHPSGISCFLICTCFARI